MSLKQYQGIDREAIWAGLFAWLQSQLGNSFVSMGRKHVQPPELVDAMQPALFQVATKETHTYKVMGAPAKLELHGLLILYVFDKSPAEDVGQEQLLAETQLNSLLKCVDNAFVPDNLNTGKFTIGGLVTHCWIGGDSTLDPGIFGSQAAAILPVHILANA